jgi:phage terminase large subunit GpA-like protein
MLSRQPIAAFRDPYALIRAAAASMRPARKISVSEAAEKHRQLATPGGYRGPWRNTLTPFLVEPMDAMLKRSVATWVMVGPSQFGKSEIFLNFIAHAVKYRPGDILVLQPDKLMAQDFAEKRIEQRLMRLSRDLSVELGPSRSDDKTFTKTFRNGMRLDVIWPTPAQLASRSVKTVLIDERDRILGDIGGEGDARTLAENRVKTFMREGLIAIAGSPVGNKGILADYAESDRNLWFWPCLECGDYFSPGFDELRRPTLTHLDVPEGCSPDEAVEKARLLCPHCGTCFEERHKVAFNARGLWLPAGCTIDRAGSIAGARPITSVAGWWFHGFANPFEAWGVIARRLLLAERHYDRTAEEKQLQTVTNTGLGVDYRPRAAGAVALDLTELEQRREPGLRLRLVPAPVRFLVASVDTHGNRWEVGVKGFSAEGESWWIDRFAIRQLADGKTDINPGRRLEHWDELRTRVMLQRYPLAEDHPLWRDGAMLPIATTVIDTGGVDGVGENAKRFWERCRKAGLYDTQITLIKGASKPTSPIMPTPTYELDAKGQEKLNGPKLYVIGVTLLKDAVDLNLRRTEPGPGCIHYPEDFASAHLEELTNEVKEDGAWVRKGANETWDLEVYAAFGARRLKPSTINWAHPPRFALPVNDAGAPLPIGSAAAAPAPAEQAEIAPAATVPAGVRVIVQPSAPAPKASPARRRGGKGWAV